MFSVRCCAVARPGKQRQQSKQTTDQPRAHRCIPRQSAPSLTAQPAQRKRAPSALRPQHQCPVLAHHRRPEIAMRLARDQLKPGLNIKLPRRGQDVVGPQHDARDSRRHVRNPRTRPPAAARSPRRAPSARPATDAASRSRRRRAPGRSSRHSPRRARQSSTARRPDRSSPGTPPQPGPPAPRTVHRTHIPAHTARRAAPPPSRYRQAAARAATTVAAPARYPEATSRSAPWRRPAPPAPAPAGAPATRPTSATEAASSGASASRPAAVSARCACRPSCGDRARRSSPSRANRCRMRLR